MAIIIIIDFGTSFKDPSCFTVVVGRAFESCSLVIVAIESVVVVFVEGPSPCFGSSCFDRMLLRELEKVYLVLN